MERVRHIADALHPALPGDYAARLDVLRAMAPRLTHGFQAIANTAYVARQGLAQFDASMEALAVLPRSRSADVETTTGHGGGGGRGRSVGGDMGGARASQK